MAITLRQVISMEQVWAALQQVVLNIDGEQAKRTAILSSHTARPAPFFPLLETPISAMHVMLNLSVAVLLPDNVVDKKTSPSSLMAIVL